MDCITELLGLRGGCEDISSNANTWLDTKVTYRELTQYIDQNDYDSVSDMFSSFREQASEEIVSEVNEYMADKYIHKTLIDAQTVGYEGKTLVNSAASANLKGVRFEQCSKYPHLAYRVTKLGFIGQYTGNVTVTYYDGVTGQSLGTDTIAAVSGQHSELSVNKQFRKRILIIAFDATLVDGYRTQINYIGGCASCGNNFKCNTHTYARPISAPIGNPTSVTYTNDMGGLYVGMSIECDTQTWMCGMKHNLSFPMLYKTAELLMEYAIFNTSAENTDTVRDRIDLEKRQMMYRENYDHSMKRALKSMVLPNDPICFRCQRGNMIAVAIP